MLLTLLERLIGLPLTRERQDAEVAAHFAVHDLATLRGVAGENLSHITQKSGALLAAQALFIVVDMYGLDHGWPRAVTMVSTVTLVAAALVVMYNLRTVYMPVPSGEGETQQRDMVARTARLAAFRGAIFNIALYLTFISVVLLGFAAIDAGLGLG